jgi:Domain of unknown function (DUF4157)
MRRRYRLRQVVNTVNLSTPLGLVVAALGGARRRPGPDGLILAGGYRLPVPPADAFTVGNVVLYKISDERTANPRLLGHEARHATQYAFCLGPVMVPAYLVAAGVSWVLTRDFASANVFERRAGLAAGGYQRAPVRRLYRRRNKT